MERAHGRGRDVVALGTLLACMLLALCPCALALDPSLDISQYAHISWKVRDGFFKGAIFSIAQTPDGYLWLATDSGVLRFDGVKSVPFEPPPDQHLPAGKIQTLLTARDGTLWLGSNTGLTSWKSGKLTQFPQLADQDVAWLIEDREGTVWASSFGTATGRLCAIQNGSVHCYGEDGRFGPGVLGLYEDKKGNLWAGVQNGLWRWRPGNPEFYPLPDHPFDIQAFAEDEDGALLIGLRGGIRRFVEGKLEPYPLSSDLQQDRVTKLLRDRDGGLWVSTFDHGLEHVHGGRVDLFAEADGLSGDAVYNLSEDREGNIWVATLNGVDRFRDFAVPTFTVKQGLLSNNVFSILAVRDGSLWFGSLGGLGRWYNGQILPYGKSSQQAQQHGREMSAGNNQDGKLNGSPPCSLFQDGRGRIWVSTPREFGYLENDRFIPMSAVPGGIVHSIAEDTVGTLWIANQDRGLIRLRGEVAEQIPWAALGSKDYAWSVIADSLQGGLWLGFYRGGVAYFVDGQVRALYSAEDGLGAGRVNGFRFEPDGTLWAATEGGLSRLKNGRIATLTRKNGLPCDTVQSVLEDDDHAFWLNMRCGLVRVARTELDAWASDQKRTIQTTVYDSSDGVRSNTFTVGYSPIVAKTTDGKLWFLPFDGVSVIDPHHLPFNKLPPPVHVEEIIADGKTYDAARGLRLPPLLRDLQIDFTALSFVAPEKVRFRYKLEGYDRDWQDAGNRRQAFYTNLPPRQYRFRVIACNNSGLWNETGDFLKFSIAPAFYQTNWFRALCTAAFLALSWAAYQFRVRQLQRESKQLRDVIDTIPGSVWSALPDGSLDFINRRWLEFSGVSLEEGLGRGWEAAFHPDELGRFVDEWRAAVACGKAMESEARVRRADGQYRWLLIRNVPLRDGAGKIVKWYGTSTDIDDRKRAEEERERLRQLEADLAHINRVSMMGELAASVAHEVNQPLAGVVSNASASLRWLAGAVPNVEEVREGLQRIVRDGKRAGEVIARIRALTRRAEMPREKLDLNDTMREVLALVGDEAKGKSVIIRTRFAEDLSPVSGDRVQLQQVVLNLVLNGIEAMSSVGGRARELVITTRNGDADQVQVSVEDSGIGIDPQKLDKIFDSFYTTKPSGMGMGLSISRSILQAHGGRLWATAKEGPGTVFHFTLPKYHEGESHAGV